MQQQLTCMFFYFCVMNHCFIKFHKLEHILKSLFFSESDTSVSIVHTGVDSVILQGTHCCMGDSLRGGNVDPTATSAHHQHHLSLRSVCTLGLFSRQMRLTDGP